MQRYEIITNFAHMTEGVKNIECLSLFFTAGVALGTVLVTPSAGLLLPFLALPFFLQKRMIRWPEEVSVGLLLATFLLLGIFCARSAALPVADEETSLEVFCASAAARVRALIDAIPFPSQGTAPLLKALLTGDRSSLSPETVQVFRGSGASHLLALSGLHMGILYLLFDYLTKALGNSPTARRIRFGLILGAAFFFTLMTGAGPSIVRAFLFIGLNETLRLLGRPRKAIRVFCVALLIQLALDPGVIRSLGFQLSYLAMAGIFLLYPILEKWYPKGSRYNPLRWLWNTAALSISCQVFTAPLAWLRFHTFPKYFLLTNLLALPLTTALLSTAVVTILLSAAGLCPALLVTATDGLGRLLLWVLEIICAM